MTAYYNENDPKAAEWLRELVAEGHIATGDVDERSVLDIRASDLTGYTQHHFFAGVGVWSHALRRAGWPDDRPVWTGSCPCQPFSVAGKRGGVADERHLWPAWFRLIRESRPDTLFGEQVASPAGRAWFDLVSADLEGMGYAVGAADTCAASVGAPHIRQRLYWIGVGNAIEPRLERHGWDGDDGNEPGRLETDPTRPTPATSIVSGSVADADGGNPGAERVQRGGEHGLGTPDRRAHFWSDGLWLRCTDGKSRLISPEPALFPLVAGTPGRVGLLRGAGNALCSEQAEAFIAAYLDVEETAYCPGRQNTP